MTPPPGLLDQVRQVMRLKHMSLRTEQSYVHYIRDYILFHHKRHPREMGVEEIRAYLSHLAVAGRVAASTQNAALSAILFLYRDVLQIDLPSIDRVERARHSRRVPVVFSRAEVQAILAQLEGVPRLIASLLYGWRLQIRLPKSRRPRKSEPCKSGYA